MSRRILFPDERERRIWKGRLFLYIPLFWFEKRNTDLGYLREHSSNKYLNYYSKMKIRQYVVLKNYYHTIFDNLY